jgi:hypothetical protein
VSAYFWVVSPSKHSDRFTGQQRCTVPFLSHKSPGPCCAHGRLFAFKYAYMRPILRGSSPPTNNLHRVPFYLIFSLIMLTVLHGASVLKVLILLSLNYALAKATGGTRFAVPVTWIFNGGVLLANEWYEGYAFANLHSGFAFLVSLTGILITDTVFRTPGVGYTHVGTSTLTSPCCDSCHSASTIIGLATISALRM